VACHTPLALHVCGCRPLHCVAPGVQTPVHAPDTHAWFEQAEGELHCPLALQVSTALLTH
jgi:hypothetical protein